MERIKQCRSLCAVIESISTINKSKAYIVGGFVREYLFHIIKHKVIHEELFQDIDIVIECSKETSEDVLVNICKAIKNLFSIECTYFSEYCTVRAQFLDINIDIAYTRREHYPYAGSPPEIEIISEGEYCSIREDHFRRDFRCNTFAMLLEDALFVMDASIDKNCTNTYRIVQRGRGNRVVEHNTEQKSSIEYTEVVFADNTKSIILSSVNKALEDIRNNELCILHERSFYDDPTRIIRMFSFLTRFNMTIEKTTYTNVKEALKEQCFENISLIRIEKELNKAYSKSDIFLLSIIYIQNTVINSFFREYTIKEQKKLIFLISSLEKTPYVEKMSKKEQIFMLYCIFSGDFLENTRRSPKRYMKYIWEVLEYKKMRTAVETIRLQYIKYKNNDIQQTINDREYLYNLMYNTKKIFCIYLLFLVEDEEKKIVEEFLDVCYNKKSKIVVFFETIHQYFPALQESMRPIFYKRLTKAIFLEKAHSKKAQYIIALRIVKELLLEK